MSDIRDPRAATGDVPSETDARDPARLDGVDCAVITLSDRAHAGEYEDRSGPIVVERLRRLGARVGHVELLPDGVEPLATRLRALAAVQVRICLCTGGTGIGPRDFTPEALLQVADRRIPGLAEMFRSESARQTPLAWLSRAEAVQVGRMLVFALPGSVRAVQQGMDILTPVLAHARAMMDGAAHA